MDIDDLDLPLLKSLRDGFLRPSLEAGKGVPDYWSSRHALTQYHETFAQRIGWKWQAIVDELSVKLLPHPTRILDFGCGTGIASLVWATRLKPESVTLWDRSALSTRFAEEIVKPVAPTSILNREPEDLSGQFVLLSHLANELSPEQTHRLTRLLATSEGFCWVEPGTPEASRVLVEIRKRLLGEFTAIAPCPHQSTCGLEAESKNPRMAWCHHFARTPAQAFQSGFWKKVSDGLGIDLRSLPTSYLAMRKKQTSSENGHRLLGRPRFFKGYAQFWDCSMGKVEERKILFRKNPSLVEKLEDSQFALTLSEAELEGSTPLQ